MKFIDPEIPLQQNYTDDPWKFFCSCIALNQCTGLAAKQVMPYFFLRIPTPKAMVESEYGLADVILRPLGLASTRANRMRNLALSLRDTHRSQFKNNNFDRESILSLPGLGKYAADSYQVFVKQDYCPQHYEEPIDKEVWAEVLRGGK